MPVPECKILLPAALRRHDLLFRHVPPGRFCELDNGTVVFKRYPDNGRAYSISNHPDFLIAHVHVDDDEPVRQILPSPVLDFTRQ